MFEIAALIRGCEIIWIVWGKKGRDNRIVLIYGMGAFGRGEIKTVLQAWRQSLRDLRFMKLDRRFI